MKAIPGVELAAITSALPTTNTNPSAVGGVTIEGFAIEDRPGRVLAGSERREQFG